MSGSPLRILIATDLEQEPDRALVAGATWLRRLGGVGTAVVVGREPSPELAALLDERVDRVAHGLTVVRQVAVGSPAATILDTAKAIDADLVVLGAPRTGSSDSAPAVDDSVVADVLARASVPVLVGREGGEHGPILAFSDLSPASRSAIEAARALAAASGVQAKVLHCLEEPIETEATYAAVDGDPEGEARDARRAAHEQLVALCRDRTGDALPTAVIEGSVVPGLLAAAAAHDASLVVLASHGRTGLARVLLGSVAAEIVRSIDRSVLVTRRDSAHGDEVPGSRTPV
jgi:nucleotide-binding universal stress UspA family protein